MKEFRDKNNCFSSDSSSVQVKAEALYDFQTNEPDELSFTKGDTIVVLEQVLYAF